MGFRLNIATLLAIVALVIVLFSSITIWILSNNLVLDINKVTLEKRIAEMELEVEEWGRYILLSRQVDDRQSTHDVKEVQGAAMLAVLDSNFRPVSKSVRYTDELPPEINLMAESEVILDPFTGAHRVLIPFDLSPSATSSVRFEDFLFADYVESNEGSSNETLSGFVLAEIPSVDQIGKTLLLRIMLIFGIVITLVVSAFLFAINRLIGMPIRHLAQKIEQGGEGLLAALNDHQRLTLTEAEKLSKAFAVQHQVALDANLNLETKVMDRTKELVSMAEQLRQLAFRATHDSDDEARRIAAEVHDNLCTKVFVLKNVMDMYHSTLKPDSQSAIEIEKYLDHLTVINDDARSIIGRYRLHTTSYLGLESGLDETLHYMTASNPLITDMTFTNNSKQLSMVDTIAHPEIIKIVQEAISNINKHTQATSVELLTEDEPGSVRVRVIDNGGGFSQSSDSDSHGLVIMRERANYIKGSLTIIPTTDGTEISLLVPVGDIDA